MSVKLSCFDRIFPIWNLSRLKLFQDSFIEYNSAERIREYKNFLTAEGDRIDEKIRSEERKGWTKIPFAAPAGVVVTHATINIGTWIVKLAAKANM